MTIKTITKSTKKTIGRASSLLKKHKESNDGLQGIEFDIQLLSNIDEGYVLIREIREDIIRLHKAVQKKRASFFFRKGKRKNETYDLSKIARLRVFHNEMKKKLQAVSGIEKRVLEMHCSAQGNLLRTLIHDYFEIVGKIDETKKRLKTKMSQIGFENASFHYENELMPTNEARIVRFHVPESMEEENELCEKIKAIEDIEDTVDEVHFLYNAIDIAVHGHGETLDRIEQYASEGAAQLKAGMKKTSKAAKQQKFCTICRIILSAFLVSFLLIILLTVYTWI